METISIASERTSAQLYKWSSAMSNSRNILLLPSGAGLFSCYSDRLNKVVNKNRFDLYSDLCQALSESYNVYLISFSGQQTGLSTHLYSLNQSITDIKEAICHIGNIHGVIGVCTGAQAFLEYAFRNEVREIPIYIWDMPGKVHWSKSSWFMRKYPFIKSDSAEFSKTHEPIETIKDHTCKIFYGYTENNRQQPDHDYTLIINYLNNEGVDVEKFFDIGHIPAREQNEKQFKRFIHSISTKF